MKLFMDEDFLLESETAKRLYHDYAEKMPIIDYHCHINPEDIAKDKRYDSITDIWLGGDHYKWRLMRANGAPESEVTEGLATNPEMVFNRFAEALPKAIGNAMYHWTYLELKRYFHLETPLNAIYAKEIYTKCNERLKEKDMSARGIIEQSNVKLICTTDDPIDDLHWHEIIAADKSFDTKVLPAFRPDKALGIEKDDFAEYIEKLGSICRKEIFSFRDLTDALKNRIDYFAEHGCRASDHGLAYCMYAEADEKTLDSILQKALKGEKNGAKITVLEAEQFKTALLLFLAKNYCERGWVMQIHFGVLRNNNTRLFKRIGADTGFDVINGQSEADCLSPLLNRMDSEGVLPRTILYSLNSADNEIIAAIAGCFMADAECPGKVQLGAAWWYNDTRTGMLKQLTDYANISLLGNFVGMLTDSRSFLSYTRHEYFRRILCNYIGQMVENGEYHNDMNTLGQIVCDISYNNTRNFFGFE